MNLVSKFILKGKAWQLFLIYFLPVSLVIIIGYSIEPAFYEKVNILATHLPIIIWFSVIGSALQVKFNFYSRRMVSYFYFALISLSAIIVFAVVTNWAIGTLLFAFYFFYIFIALYVSKFIVSIEKGKVAEFSDSLGVFFYIWMLPISIFWLQPRINGIVNIEK